MIELVEDNRRLFRCPECNGVVFNITIIDTEVEHENFGDCIVALICDDVDCEHMVHIRRR